MAVAKGLLDAVNELEGAVDPHSGDIDVPDGFLTPGFCVALAAFAWRKRVDPSHIRVQDKVREYFSAVGFPRALGQPDTYQYGRRNVGVNYSTLEHLDVPEATDKATSAINGCIRSSLGRDLPSAFVDMLCDVVGDLHENVWAHGKASGFSLAQKWKSSPWNPLSREYCLEFALADSGIGFLREVQNAGLGINSDREAIEWCVQEGHSTKKLHQPTEWAQRVPPDVIGNPLTGIEKTRATENHHMGIGLYKLMRLVREFRGHLWLVTGASALILRPGRKESYIDLANRWQGVAISCQFRSGDIATVRADIETGNKDVEEIMRILGGRRG